jgi:orotate phosphoribosyltransferase
MGLLQELAGRVEEVATAGGRFADTFVRTAGFTVSRALAFVEREIGYAQKLGKKTTATKARNRNVRDRDEE